MSKPLSTRLAALEQAERIAPQLVRDAANLYGIKPDEMFDGGRPRTHEYHHARLDVLRRLTFSVPNLSQAQVGKLLHLNPKSVSRMLDTIRTMEVKGHQWKL
jgi:hypothetical protein